jgi:hypothetical protein
MPTSSFLEVNPVARHIGPPADASDYTRSIRLAATIAPYIGMVGNQKPTLGWKSNELATQVRITAPIYGILRNLYPNGK